MPLPDLPPPAPVQPFGARLKRSLKWLAAFSIVVAATAVLLVARGDSTMPIHMLIATALGAGLSVMLGGALMTLIFLSHSSGHDAAAGATHEDPTDKD